MPATLDGIDDFFNAGNISTSGISTITISGWVRSLISHKGTLIAKDASLTERAFVVYASRSVINRFNGFYVSSTGNSWDLVNGLGQNLGPPILNGNWHNILCTYNGTQGEVWIDGASIASGGSPGTIYNSSAIVSIGAQNQGSTAIFNGLVNDIAIWNRVLTSDEIFLLYNSKIKYLPLYLHYDDLIAYWPSDDGRDGVSADGDILHDRSKNGNNAVGDNGGNNSGLTWSAENLLSYPYSPIFKETPISPLLNEFYLKKFNPGIRESLNFGIR